MQCVIVCGGLATRLGNIAGDIPKSMIKINGEPFLALRKRTYASEFGREWVTSRRQNPLAADERFRRSNGGLVEKRDISWRVGPECS